MSSLRTSDYKQLLELNQLLFDCKTKAQIADVAMHHFARLIRAEGAVWNEFDNQYNLVSAAFSEELAGRKDLVELGAEYQRLAHTHPALEQNLVKFGGVNALRLTDDVSQQEFEKRPIFQEVYKPIQFKYLMGFDCGSKHVKGLATAFSREKQNFSDRDLAFFKEAAKSFTKAYQSLEHWDRLAHERMHHWDIWLDASLHITQISKSAAELLENFYETGEVRYCLPQHLRELFGKRFSQNGNANWMDRQPVVITHRNHQIQALTSRISPTEFLIRIGVPNSTNMDLLENEWSRLLTAKQKEVARWMVMRQSTAQIAKIMNIADSTVHKHKKGIYERLHAANEREAVQKLLQP